MHVIAANRGVLKVEIRPGEIITVQWEGPEPVESLREHFNRDIVLEGLAAFRPSGVLRRIDADAVVPASSTDEFFRTVPHAVPCRDYRTLVRLRPGEPSVYAQMLGSIPAEESDEEFEAAVEALR